MAKRAIDIKDAEFATILGKRIAILRLYHNVTQDELGRKLNTTQKSISKWELGKFCVPATCLLKICEMFNRPLAFFDPKNKQLDEMIGSKQ